MASYRVNFTVTFALNLFRESLIKFRTVLSYKQKQH